MQTKTLNIYSLGYTQAKTYFIATAFVVGNIMLPQLAHTIPNGGFIFLPIYFFTLIAAYKYGWKVGILTAVCSPIVNHILFGMPPLAVLPAILIKSIFLALAASFAARKFKRISIAIICLVVLAYQILGTMVEWVIIGEFLKATQDFRIGIPGMLFQIGAGYFIIKYIIRK